MKTEKELNELKEEYTEIKKKLAELTEKELKQVTDGNEFQPALFEIEVTQNWEFKPTDLMR